MGEAHSSLMCLAMPARRNFVGPRSTDECGSSRQPAALVRDQLLARNQRNGAVIGVMTNSCIPRIQRICKIKYKFSIRDVIKYS